LPNWPIRDQGATQTRRNNGAPGGPAGGASAGIGHAGAPNLPRTIETALRTAVTIAIVRRLGLSRRYLASVTKAELTYASLDPISRARGILVLPDAHHRPAGTLQFGIYFSVSRNIPIDLLLPPNRIVFRSRLVVQAAMPEATIDKDSYPGLREENVRSPSSPEW
jgi:hypothetical protein